MSDALFNYWLDCLCAGLPGPYQALHMSFLTDMDEDRFFDPETPKVARIGLRRWTLKG